MQLVKQWLVWLPIATVFALVLLIIAAAGRDVVATSTETDTPPIFIPNEVQQPTLDVPLVEEPAPVPTATPFVHLVRAGETLSTIATLYGITIDDIIQANPDLGDPNRIDIDQPIVIP